MITEAASVFILNPNALTNFSLEDGDQHAE